MLGLLGTLNLAAQSLQTQMTGVEVTGQNLANVNTAGYTRQTVDIETNPDIQTTFGPEGTGAGVVSIQQAVNTALNSQIQSQQSTSGYWNAQQSALQTVEDDLDTFLSSATSSTSTNGSLSSSGLSSLITKFFNDIQDVATSPTDAGARATLISDAQDLATTFNEVNSGLSQMNTTLNTTLGNNVDSANQLLSNIAALNQKIATAQFGGGNANDLMDDRQQDLQNLAQLTDITTSPNSDGTVDVSIGGQAMITGNQVANLLQTYNPGNGQLLVETTAGNPVTLGGGSMQGTIDARDGTLANLQTGVNTLANTLITQFNNIYSTGYGLDGTNSQAFFTGTDASDIAVSANLANNPRAFQASVSATNTGDSSIATQLANLGQTTLSALNNETFEGSMNGLVGDLGNATQTANNQVTNQNAVMNMLTTQQSTISGVSVDEEMTHLLTYQQAYEAAAELVTTVNQMLGDTLAMKSGS